MISLDAEQPPDRRGWYPLLVAGVVYAGVICVVAAVRADPVSTSDFRDFWENAVHFRQTGEISSEHGVHNYLPFFTGFMAPWGLLPLRVAAALFTLLSLGLFGLTVVLVEALVNDGLGPRPRIATLIAIVLALPYVHSCAVLGQMGLLLLLLIVATWFLFERSQEWPAGVTLGMAALIKVLPAILIVLFLVKLRWRVAVSALGTIVLLGAGLPLASVGYSETVSLHAAYYERAVSGHSAKATILAEKPQKAKYSNNSLPIVLRRLLSDVNADPSDSEPERQLYVNAANLSQSTVWWIYLAITALLAAISIAVSLRDTRPWPPDGASNTLTLRAQYGVWCCLMLLASPLLWTHYLVLAYWPLAIIADHAERTKRENQRPCAGCVLALAVWLVGVVLLAWPAARAAGAQVFSVGALWVGAATIARAGSKTSPPRHGSATQ